MKWSALFLSLLALPAFSSTGENHTFNITDSQGFDAVLNGQKTHTEYRTETHASTCYRTEIAGYRTVCTGGGYPYPYPAPGPYPRPYPGPGPGPGYCRQEPIYRTVPYTCYQQVQVPY